ncbi:voltage-dependent calcium channel subunit alpha-2/delta-3-like [Ornithodoros turicata]|uniref:voltage-dependent calcium channel subunit alpha-2/delta-3-like n=1 Tax=Ornithodoros turicata TaxID=34597 RepID=UPI0031389906
MGSFRSTPAYVCCLAISALFISVLVTADTNGSEAVANDVRNWAWRFGTEISNQSLFASNYTEIKENFEEFKADAHYRDIAQLTEKILRDLGNLVSLKIESLKPLIQEAEAHAKEHKYSNDIDYTYLNARKVYPPNTTPEFPEDVTDEEKREYLPLELKMHSNFQPFAVNFSQSAVHVATNIYGKAPPVLNAIKWSEGMNSRFRNNRVMDPFISWQFFCSSTGFLRVYPALKWVDDGPDMYECRTRPWYVQAAASAKDVVILLDGSGSMMGLRKEIARTVIINILDTLTDNDYVSILRFSEIIQPVAPCFGENLVQANAQNIREFKEHLGGLPTTNIANFTAALTQAFEMLQKFNRSKMGSQCNQAIMLITDGAPYTYEEIFRRYNWPNIPVRVFTYLIGKEVTDTREVNWMACANRGYYTHVTTLAEVREQVQKYIPVMGRPIVLSRKHPIIWTSVYGDMTEPKLTDWLWAERQQAQFRKLILHRNLMSKNVEQYRAAAYEADADGGGVEDTVDYAAEAVEYAPRRTARSVSTMPVSAMSVRRPQKPKTVTLYTTVAAPVFNTSNDTSGTANLLGVVGIDVPIKEFQKHAQPFKLGVNAYAFMINKNGHLLFHPDLRPLHADMLKPYYSNVDLLEVELLDNENTDRIFTDVFTEIRRNMINGRRGWMELLPVRVHMDSMKRVVTRRHNYQYGSVPNSGFSFGIAVPQPYGSVEILGEVQVQSREEDWRQYFQGDSWRVHPDWEYCVDIHKEYDNPEMVIRDFLDRVMRDSSQSSESYKWKPDSKRQFYNTMVCDKELVQSLVFDAKVTSPAKIMARQPSKQLYSHVSKDTTFKSNGIVVTFVATRSGLLRFTDHRSEDEKTNSERPFYDVNTRAIDDLFYKRAVDFYQTANDTAFIYSVPFDAGARYAAEDSSTIYVTGSRAVFLGTDKKAPAAVVGLQIKHSVFEEKFFNITSKCENQKPCAYTCTNEALDCYLLDNNGFVIVSGNRSQVGKFFGEIDNTLFISMVKWNVYKKVRIYDYQAICFDEITPSGPANFRTSPFHTLWKVLAWGWQHLVAFLINFEFSKIFNLEWAVATAEYEYVMDYLGDDPVLTFRKTRPRPCDKEIDLYEMQPPMDTEPIKGKLYKCSDRSCDKQFIVQSVPSSNLVMLVVYTDCNCTSTPAPLVQEEVPRNETIFCNHSSLPRQRPEICINYHAEEVELKQQCGMAACLRVSTVPLLGGLLLAQLLARRL